MLKHIKLFAIMHVYPRSYWLALGVVPVCLVARRQTEMEQQLSVHRTHLVFAALKCSLVWQFLQA